MRSAGVAHVLPRTKSSSLHLGREKWRKNKGIVHSKLLNIECNEIQKDIGACMYVRMYVCMYVCIYVCTYMYMCNEM